MAKCSIPFVLATFLATIVLIIWGLSFGTTHWEEYRVNRSLLTVIQRGRSSVNTIMGKYFHTRDIGLFLECFPGTDTEFLDISPNKVNGICFHVEYEIQDFTVNPSTEYTIYINLRRCIPAFFGAGILMLICAYICGLIGCCKSTPKWCWTACAFSVGGVVFVALAMSFFHGSHYMSREVLNGQSEVHFYSRWPEELKAATSYSVGWSYILAWVGLVLAILCAVLYAVSGYLLKHKYEEDGDDDVSFTKDSVRPESLHSYGAYYFDADRFYNYRRSLPRPAMIPRQPMYALSPGHVIPQSSLPAIAYIDGRSDSQRSSKRGHYYYD